MILFIKKWHDSFIVIDRYEKKLSLWESFKRRFWAMKFKKQSRPHMVKYSYDFNYGELLQKEFDNPDSIVPRETLLEAQKQLNQMKRG